MSGPSVQPSLRLNGRDLIELIFHGSGHAPAAAAMHPETMASALDLVENGLMSSTAPSLPASRFIFVRHGETDWNRRGVFQGRSDIPLNEKGLAQAREAARCIAGAAPGRIVSSPLRRAVQTGDVIAAAVGLDLQVEPDLVECDFGALEGASIAAAMERHGLTRKEQLAQILPPDAEQWDRLCLRSIRTVRHWLGQANAGTVVFVGHDAFLQSLSEVLCGAWFPAAHGMPCAFIRDDGQWRVRPLQDP